jgi:hypothetical protein
MNIGQPDKFNPADTGGVLIGKLSNTFRNIWLVLSELVKKIDSIKPGENTHGFVHTSVMPDINGVNTDHDKRYYRKGQVDALVVRHILAGTGIHVANNANDVTVSNSAPEATSVSNVGTGAGDVYRDMTGAQVNLKTIKAGTGIGVANNADDITISNGGHSQAYDTIRLSANQFRGCGFNAYLPASLVTLLLPASQAVYDVLQFEAGKDMGAMSHYSLPFRVPAFLSANFVIRVYGFSDNADSLNAVSLDVGNRMYQPSISSLDVAVSSFNNGTQVCGGIYQLWKYNFVYGYAGPYAADNFVCINVRRNGSSDGHLGNFYLLRADISVVVDLV